MDTSTATGAMTGEQYIMSLDDGIVRRIGASGLIMQPSESDLAAGRARLVRTYDTSYVDAQIKKLINEPLRDRGEASG